MSSREVTRVRNLLAETDPQGCAVSAYDDSEGRAALTRILASPVPASSRVRSTIQSSTPLRMAAVVVATVAVVTAVAIAAPSVLPGRRSESAYAATPPLLHYSGSRQNARALLLGLAAAARRQPEPGAGRYDYIQARGWSLDGTRDGTGQVSSRLEPTWREQWVDAAGSGRIEGTRSGRRTDTSRLYGPGQLGGPPPPPSDPAAARAELARRSHGYGTFEWLVAVQDVWLAQVVTPEVQSAMLQALAGLRGLSADGAVTDRAGRTGVAVSATPSVAGGLERYTMIFDSGTGAVLDYEEVALEPGEFHVRPPATVDYTVFLRRGRVSSVNTRP